MARRALPTATLLSLFLGVAPSLAAPAVRVTVDAAEAARHVLHTQLVLPVRPGPVTLVYPKWIPGEHGPTGPVSSITGLRITSGKQVIPWRRDDEDMFAFHVEVPANASTIEVTFDVVSTPGGGNFTAAASSSAQLAVVSWNQLVLYPRGARAREVLIAPALTLPSGWTMATALPVRRQGDGRVEFEDVSLETLVDSPVLTGRMMRAVDLSPGSDPPHHLHVAADSEAALAFGEEIVDRYRRLVAEAGALFGARHYRGYRFLLSLSEHVAHFGLEHHESSDNRLKERVFLDEAQRVIAAGLLPHEYVHSWNGKFRRPLGLATPDFQQPMKGALLWVYEGLTTYLGEVLTARSGLRSVEQEREAIALTAANLDVAPGRTWRSLSDTAVAAQILYGAPPEWRAWRRGVDFYPESELIWLEVDAIIRSKTGGQRSLDDFCRAFHGQTSGPPAVVPYTFDDVVAALAGVAPHDWRAFFAARLDTPTAHAPIGGLEAAGWRLVYRETPTSFHKQVEQTSKALNLSFSLGMVVKEDGAVLDVVPGAPAARAGLAPGMRVIAVNGLRFGGEAIKDAVRATKKRPDLDLLVESGDYFRTYRVSYGGGARYPALERRPNSTDLLEAILRPRAPK